MTICKKEEKKVKLWYFSEKKIRVSACKNRKEKKIKRNGNYI